MKDTNTPSVLVCREFQFASPSYGESLTLRHEVLRKPLGLDWEPGAFDDEKDSFHLGCFREGRFVASLILKPLGDTKLRMRQFAVDPAFQRQGVGSALASFAEQFAKNAGYRIITAHARESAIPFYKRMGYSVEGDPFIEVTIPHSVVSKSL